MALTVSELAKRAGVSGDTIRYYERFGLIPSPRRSVSGYRQYGEADADRVRLIRGAKRMGLRLRDVRELLNVLDRGLCPCGHAESLLRRRIREVDVEIGRLGTLRGELLSMARQLERQPSGERDPWPCVVEFIRKSDGRGAAAGA